MNKTLDDLVLSMKDEMIKEISEIIKFKSYKVKGTEDAPFGIETKKALDYALELGKKYGFKTKNVDNYAGHVEFGNGKKTFGVLGHLDVVPEGTGWSVDPYGGVIKDGYLWGRGATDDKGPIIAALFALKAVKAFGIEPKSKVRIIFGTNEESGWECMKHYFKHETKPDWGVTPDGDFPMINVEKGIADVNVTLYRHQRKVDEEFSLLSFKGGDAPNMVAPTAEAVVKFKDKASIEEVRKYKPSNGSKIEVTNKGHKLFIKVTGKSAHGANPSAGVNAISALVDLLSHFHIDDDEMQSHLENIAKKIGYETDGKSLGISGQDGMSGPLTVNLGLMEITPKKMKFVLNIRYPIFFNLKMIKKQIEESLKGMEVSIGHHHDPLFVSPDNELIHLLSEVYEDVTGQKSFLIAIGGGTYARAIPNAVAFGPTFPGHGSTEHQPDERISIDDLTMIARIYAQLYYKILS
jgi:succinyl-diaminopimelate desuccinylase